MRLARPASERQKAPLRSKCPDSASSAAVGAGVAGGGGSAGQGSGGKGLSVVIPEGPEGVLPLESPAHVNVNLARLLGEASARGAAAGVGEAAAGGPGLAAGVGGGAGRKGREPSSARS